MSDLSNSDPMARLATQNPVTNAVDGENWDETKERIFRSVIAVQPRRRWWKRRSFFAVVIVVGAIGTSAAGYSLTRPVTNPTAFSCFAQDSLTGKQALTRDTGSPQASCETLWKTGIFGKKVPEHFTACVRASGTAAVFPTGEQSICSTLGLFPAEPLDGEENAAAQLPYIVGDELSTQASCPTFRTVENDIRSTLKRLGLRGWKMRMLQPITKEWPCASWGLVPQSKTINLVSRENFPPPK
jgi:hypothetical protein